MFIKLTKVNNMPIWLNASFIVTVEPRREGGAIVVPIGDGLDYDVKESPETVLRMLDGAPVAQVVPVPVSDCLTKTPDDVSPEPETTREPKPNAHPAAKPVPPPAKPAAAPVAADAPVDAPARPAEEVAESSAEEEKTPPPVAEKKPRKRAMRAKAKAAASADEKPDEKSAEVKAFESIGAEPKPAAAEPPPEKQFALEMSEDQVARLVKLAPKSVAKLKNTLATQFRIADVGMTVMALQARGAFSLDGSRVIWPTPIADW